MKAKKVNKTKKAPLKTRRLSFPRDEKVHPWLSMLLDAYSAVDRGVEQAIESEKKKGRKPACVKGCSSCCITHSDIPVYPLELVGISWYVTERISGEDREKLKVSLRGGNKKKTCPFLLQGECSIHPLRPIACRQFNVFGRACAEDEDPYYSRREDVLPPVKKYVDQAFFIMFPFYGVEKESERKKLVEEGAMHRTVRVLQECRWATLADRMDLFDMGKKDNA
jgi:Fe-S-cluster containining protein